MTQRFVAIALILCTLIFAGYLLEKRNQEAPLSMAKPILDNPEPYSKLEIFYSDKIEVRRNELTSESVFLLTKISNYLKMTGFESLLIEGHTDRSFPEAKNRYLGKEKANAVKFYLTNNLRLPIDRFKTKSFGSSRPLPGSKPKNTVVLVIRR